MLKILLIASAFVPVAAYAQDAKAPATATFLMKEDVDKVSKSEQSQRTKDENVAVVDIAIKILPLVSCTGLRPGIRLRPAAEHRCRGAQTVRTGDGALAGGTHDHQTEGYYIISCRPAG